MYSARLRACLHPLVELRRLCLSGPRGTLVSRSLNKILGEYEAKGILARTSSRRDVFVDRQGLEDIKAERREFNVKLRHEAIKSALAFGGKLADTMLAEDDLEGTEMMLESLGKIWGRKLLRDD